MRGAAPPRGQPRGAGAGLGSRAVFSHARGGYRLSRCAPRRGGAGRAGRGPGRGPAASPGAPPDFQSCVPRRGWGSARGARGRRRRRGERCAGRMKTPRPPVGRGERAVGPAAAAAGAGVPRGAECRGTGRGPRAARGGQERGARGRGAGVAGRRAGCWASAPEPSRSRSRAGAEPSRAGAGAGAAAAPPRSRCTGFIAPGSSWRCRAAGVSPHVGSRPSPAPRASPPRG